MTTDEEDQRRYAEEAESAYRTQTNLNDRQRAALPLILAGATDAAVAEAVGVHRVTVTRWRLAHPAVRSALSSARQSAHRAAEQTRRVLYRKALDRLTRELDEDGPKAVQVALALVGTPPPDPGPAESAEDIAGDVTAKHWRQLQLGTAPMSRRFPPLLDPMVVSRNLAGHIEEWEPSEDETTAAE